MTRWARGEKSNKKQEHEASAWDEIQPRHARRTQVNRGNRNGNSRQQSKGKEEDSDVIINPANFDRDAAETSVVAELEKLGGVHSQSETVHSSPTPVGASSRTGSQRRRKRKQAKLKSALIDTDLTSQLLQLRREDDSADREQIDEIINKDQRREKRRLKRKEAKLEAKVNPFMWLVRLILHRVMRVLLT